MSPLLADPEVDLVAAVPVPPRLEVTPVVGKLDVGHLVVHSVRDGSMAFLERE